VYIHTYSVCVRVRVCVRLLTCVRALVCVYIYEYAHAHALNHTHKHVHTHICVCVHIYPKKKKSKGQDTYAASFLWLPKSPRRDLPPLAPPHPLAPPPHPLHFPLHFLFRFELQMLCFVLGTRLKAHVKTQYIPNWYWDMMEIGGGEIGKGGIGEV